MIFLAFVCKVKHIFCKFASKTIKTYDETYYLGLFLGFDSYRCHGFYYIADSGHHYSSD